MGWHGLPSAKVSVHLPSGEVVARVCKAVSAEGLWDTQEPNTTQVPPKNGEVGSRDLQGQMT